jgi:hypothetical protein
MLAPVTQVSFLASCLLLIFLLKFQNPPPLSTDGGLYVCDYPPPEFMVGQEIWSFGGGGQEGHGRRLYVHERLEERGKEVASRWPIVVNK